MGQRQALLVIAVVTFAIPIQVVWNFLKGGIWCERLPQKCF